MKRLNTLLLLICFFSTAAYSQITQIKIVSFQVKNILPAKVDDWNTVPAALILTAQKSPGVQLKEPKLVLQIKSNGAVICGNNQSTAQPMAPFDVKTFTTNELIGMLANCPLLKEGSYQICAQFFNFDRIAISNEVCKEFKVESAKQEDYAAPTLINPENGKVFTPDEMKKPLQFRWTPLVPKPQQPVTYKLKVWQLMQGQNATAAIRANNPIVEKDVKEITQAVVANLYTGPCRPPYLCDFVWNVQALGRDNKPIGNNNGMSENWKFSVSQNTNPTNGGNPTAMMMGGANAEFKIDSAVCLPKENGLFKYHIWAHYKNLVTSSNSILINDALNFPGCPGNPNPGLQTNLRNNIRVKTGTYNPALTMTDILDVTSGTISNILPLPTSFPASLAPGTNLPFQFDYTTPTNLPTQFTFYGLVDDGMKFTCAKNSRNEYDSLKYPKCPCSACDEINITTTTQGNITNNGNGSLSFTALVAASPKKVKRIRTELVYFDMKPDDVNCLVCNKNSTYFGNFTNATTTNNNFTSTLPFSHSAQFDALSDINISGGITINFTVSIPPMVSCCNADVNFCIRYVITFEDCTVCNKLTCYNYKITGCQKQ